jgi:Fe-S-cluster formation regulator IscX/YfhJ
VVEFAKNCSVEDQHEIAERLLDMYNKLDNAQENHAEYLFQIIETEEFRSSLPKDYWNQKFKHVEKIATARRPPKIKWKNVGELS